MKRNCNNYEITKKKNEKIVQHKMSFIYAKIICGNFHLKYLQIVNKLTTFAQGITTQTKINSETNKYTYIHTYLYKYNTHNQLYSCTYVHR